MLNIAIIAKFLHDVRGSQSPCKSGQTYVKPSKKSTRSLLKVLKSLGMQKREAINNNFHRDALFTVNFLANHKQYALALNINHPTQCKPFDTSPEAVPCLSISVRNSNLEFDLLL